jgi:hypothetical protein
MGTLVAGGSSGGNVNAPDGSVAGAVAQLESRIRIISD